METDAMSRRGTACLAIPRPFSPASLPDLPHDQRGFPRHRPLPAEKHGLTGAVVLQERALDLARGRDEAEAVERAHLPLQLCC